MKCNIFGIFVFPVCRLWICGNRCTQEVQFYSGEQIIIFTAYFYVTHIWCVQIHTAFCTLSEVWINFRISWFPSKVSWKPENSLFFKKYTFLFFVFVQIKATLAMSVICALLAAAGTGYFSWELSNRPGEDPCGESYWSCSYMIWRFNVRV